MLAALKEAITGKEIFASEAIELSDRMTASYVVKEKKGRKQMCLRFYNDKTEHKETTDVPVISEDIEALKQLFQYSLQART